MHERQESSLTLQLGKANNVVEVLENEFALENAQIEAIEIKNTEEIRKLSYENEEKVLKELLKNEFS